MNAVRMALDSIGDTKGRSFLTMLGIIIGVTAVLVLVGKAAFGGWGSYPFHLSALGYCTAAASWPEQMLQNPNEKMYTLDVLENELQVAPDSAKQEMLCSG